MNTQAQEVPLIELLKAVPKTARLIVESEDGISSRAHPVGDLCHKAAEALETKQVCENAAPAQDTETMAVAIALQEQIRQLKEQPAQEPVAWIKNWADGSKEIVPDNYEGSYPVYTHPAQPLTDDEILSLLPWQLWREMPNEIKIALARDIEQAHGIGVKDEH